jgi:UDP-GlcNAc:undecaprenyl-phosphate GlcNAc-1-phosphate transferase
MSNTIWIALPAITAALLSATLTPVVARIANAIGAVDMPGNRKIHTIPIPRLGGLAVVVSIVATFVGAPLLSGGRWQLPLHLASGLAIGLLPVFLISVADDVRSVSARYKLLAHVLGAVIAVSLGISLGPVVHLFGTPIHIGLFAAPLSVLWIVGVTNAFNIIDGLDGLSAGLALISAVSMAAVFIIAGDPRMGAVALVLAGALAGFLPYNMHPARLFLGDTGSTAIGFCLAAFALRGGSTLSTGFAALVPVFILGLPIADTLIAMARRTVGRLESHTGGMFVPDRNHIHHRLLAIGIDHGRAVLILHGAGLVLAIAAFVSVFLNAREAGLFVVALTLAGFVGVQRLGYDEFAILRRGTVLKVYEMPAVKRGMFVVFVDIFLVAVAAYLAVALKTDQWRFQAVDMEVLQLATTLAPVTVLVFRWCGMYRGSWRVAGIQDLTRCGKAVSIVTVVGAALMWMLTGDGHTLSIVGIYGVLSLLLTTALRASYVVLENTKLRGSHKGRPVLVYGAGARGVAAVSELFQNSRSEMRPIGFIDDDPTKRGRLVSGLPVFGAERELESIIRTHRAEALLVASRAIPDERLERATRACRLAGATIFRLDIRLERLTEDEMGDEPFALPPPAAVAKAKSVTTPSAPLRLPSIEACPSCREHQVHRSKARSIFERVRKKGTQKRLFRCHHCGWRGWLVSLDYGRSVDNTELDPMDLSAIERSLDSDRFASNS